jgi:hypothetical protein
VGKKWKKNNPEEKGSGKQPSAGRRFLKNGSFSEKDLPLSRLIWSA